LDGGKIVAEGTPGDLKQLAPGGHIRLGFADRDGLSAAARVVPGADVDAEQLTMTVPSSGSVGELKRLLDRFDDEAITIGTLASHAPDLDDVFFALTGGPSTGKTTRS
jgi:ABC-2 type transport system ATP-binding protein